MTGKLDDILTEDNDPFWTKPLAPVKRGKPKRILACDLYLYYHCPKAWADRAAEVCGPYLILALRLYRHWLMNDKNAITVTAAALGGPGHSRRGRLYVVTRLEMAGLIKVVEQARPGRAARVQMIERA